MEPIHKLLEGMLKNVQEVSRAVNLSLTGGRIKERVRRLAAELQEKHAEAFESLLDATSQALTIKSVAERYAEILNKATRCKSFIQYPCKSFSVATPIPIYWGCLLYTSDAADE
eukprot:TRINITY_DN10642_c0_g2_i1.p1 TRINITY_DN10642_c0_g2~~TRINITY_DN10642_c0_g2_i1.p1  ORF type:complete len:114 (-),score=19.91 TRINITY_DN10642_c0_g2_i1:55-396(-)